MQNLQIQLRDAKNGRLKKHLPPNIKSKSSFNGANFQLMRSFSCHHLLSLCRFEIFIVDVKKDVKKENLRHRYWVHGWVSQAFVVERVASRPNWIPFPAANTNGHNKIHHCVSIDFTNWNDEKNWKSRVENIKHVDNSTTPRASRLFFRHERLGRRGGQQQSQQARSDRWSA